MIEAAGGHQNVPRNDSNDALHADHVWSFTKAELDTVRTVEDWVQTLRRVSEVVCVTASENYALEQLEKQGLWGPEKYERAGVEFIDGDEHK